MDLADTNIDFKKIYFYVFKNITKCNIGDEIDKNSILYTYYEEYINNTTDDHNGIATNFHFLITLLVRTKAEYSARTFNYVMHISHHLKVDIEKYNKYLIAAIKNSNDVCFISLYNRWIKYTTPQIFTYNYTTENGELNYCYNYNIINHMIDMEKELCKRDSHGNTMLHYAAAFAKNSNDIQIITKLLKYIDKRKTNNKGNTPLMLAIYYYNTKSCIEAIKLLADESTVNIQNMLGENTLLMSIKKNNPPCVNNLLIECGADGNIQDKHNNTYYKLLENESVYLSNRCLICDEKADLCMYYPCMHCVICSNCMHNEHNKATTCIYCRCDYTKYYKLKYID